MVQNIRSTDPIELGIHYYSIVDSQLDVEGFYYLKLSSMGMNSSYQSF